MKTGSGEPTNRGVVCWNPFRRKDLHYPLVGKLENNTLVAVLKSCLVAILRSLHSCDLDKRSGVFIKQNGVSVSLKTTTIYAQLTSCDLEIGHFNSIQFNSNNFIYPCGGNYLRAALRKTKRT